MKVNSIDQISFQEAVTLHQQGHLAEAEAAYRVLLANDPKHFNALQLLGTVCAQQQRYPEAVDLLKQAVALDAAVAAVHHNLGNALQSLGQFLEALATYERALTLQPHYPEALNARGNAHKALQQWEPALACYEQALALQPKLAGVQINRGNVLRSLGREEDALAAYDAALAQKADLPEVSYNRANALLALQRFEAALAGFDDALALRPDYPEALNNRGNTLLALKRHEDAIATYDRALALRPGYASAWFNRGNALSALRRHDAALHCFEQALQHDPRLAAAYNGRGMVMMALQRKNEALAAYERALKLCPDDAEVLHNLGDALMLSKRYPDAAAAYERALALDAHHKYLLGAALDCRHHGCDWLNHDEGRLARILEGVRAGLPVCPPFTFVSLADGPSDQLACARIFGADRRASSALTLWHGERYSHEKIRVAYLSADFHTHATAFLMAELFELHDRERFEWFAYSFGPEREGVMRSRLERAFDHFSEVSDRSDLEIAQMLREQEIDIAVDLKGFTLHCRPGIFAHRPAPVQVNYLGYPGTMGVPYMDYIVGDATVIPPEHEPYYTEKVVRLPDSYQVNDRHRVIAERTPTRAEQGLPEEGFVFCCFNNNYKITPVFFDIWMRLLQAVPDSVLWLLESNAESARNLRKEAQQRGVTPGRLVFAPILPLPDHLARHRRADLSLDTLPVNAHTTASDALWAGLPVLTCLGKAFAGRVAASLLKAIDLPELVTDNLADYEARALHLATHPAELAALRQKLEANRLSTPLFDTDRFRRHVEAAYAIMHSRSGDGLSPENIDIEWLPCASTSPVGL